MSGSRRGRGGAGQQQLEVVVGADREENCGGRAQDGGLDFAGFGHDGAEERRLGQRRLSCVGGGCWLDELVDVQLKLIMKMWLYAN
ncbi:hypothetical protein M0R45_020449 [Rubus argutus]|uniref:Uncharacterized protein n=1 Tax=Rubus argutus TaxID=59490 RepID=A0AAW1X8E7_RUBAR